MTYRSNSGNAVVFILIAVALFGALTYTFMRGSKEGQGNLTSSKAKIIAQEILDYSQSVERAVDKLRSQGCSENQLNFNNSSVSGYTNLNAPSDGSCDVFGTNTGIDYKKLSSLYSYVWDPVFQGNNMFGSLGTVAPELGLYIGVDSLAVCEQINSILNLPATRAGDWVSMTSKFTGTFVSQNGFPDEPVATGYTGKTTGCINKYQFPANVVLPKYFFYRVLIVR